MNKYKLKNKNSNLLIYVYIITCAIAFVSKIGKVTPSATIQYGIFTFWIIVAFVKLAKKKFKFSTEELVIKRFFLVFIIPKLVIHIYSIFLFILGKIDYITRNTQSYLIILAVFSIIYIFKYRALKSTIIAACISYSAVIIYNIVIYGIITIPHAVRFFLTGDLEYDTAARLYEVHDFTFAVGYLVLYYILIKQKNSKKDVIYCYVLIIFLFMGFKRIQLIAMLLVIIYVIIGKFIVDKIKFYKFTSYCFIITSYIYIWSLSNSKFFEFLDKFNINSMGRNYYYKVIVQLCEFNPGFLGLGRNAVGNLLLNEYSYLNVAGLHSDILKYFAECGFLLFGIWMWYFLIKVINWINARYSIKVLSCYYILTLYTFVIYYTDNIDVYFVSQFIYILIVVSTAMQNNKQLDS